MLLPRGILHGLAAALAITSVCAKDDWDYTHHYVEDGVTEDLTFGAHGKIWSKDHRHIEGWSITGENFTPELHSDRIILTPPHPGSRRGGIWSDKVEKEDEWEAEFQFRASGPEKGSGLFQMWYAANPQEDVKLASLYTVGKFDGLVLAVGMYAGKGSLRAFLNDKSISFKDHHHVDQLAFASCDLNYRNTGHFIKVKVRQTSWTFEVEVDGRHCFQTHKVNSNTALSTISIQLLT
jgi:mannose-binding lectin 1